MTDFPFTATAIATLLTGIIYLYLTVVVIRHRRSDKIVHGDNNDPVMAKKIRGHANAAETIPLGLIIIALNEAMNGSSFALLLSAMLVGGRALHAYHFTRRKTSIQFRLFGMALTLCCCIIGLVGIFLGLIL